jgi:hypothetical protein
MSSSLRHIPQQQEQQQQQQQHVCLQLCIVVQRPDQLGAAATGVLSLDMLVPGGYPSGYPFLVPTHPLTFPPTHLLSPLPQPVLLFRLQPLTSLEVLDIHRNSISDLTPLTALQRLRLIHASHNRLRSLPNLRASSSLQELNVQRNQLTALTCLVTRGLQDHQQQQGGKDVEGAEGVELVAKTMTGTLRAGRGTMLPAAAAAAAAASTGVDKRLPDSAPSSSSEEVPALALPISLQHLLADHNQLPDLGHLAELEGLTRLVTLSVTGNPAVIEANLPAGLKPREGVLLCCPVGLLLLDDQQVTVAATGGGHGHQRQITLPVAHTLWLL